MDYLGEIDIEEKGLLGVGDLDAILLVSFGAAADIDVVHALCNYFHCQK